MVSFMQLNPVRSKLLVEREAGLAIDFPTYLFRQILGKPSFRRNLVFWKPVCTVTKNIIFTTIIAHRHS